MPVDLLRKWRWWARLAVLRYRLWSGRLGPLAGPANATEPSQTASSGVIDIGSERKEVEVSDSFELLVQYFEDIGRTSDYFDNIGMVSKSGEERKTIRGAYQSEVGSIQIWAMIDLEWDMCQVVGLAPLCVPEGARAAVAEAITRANYGARIGTLEMDVEDGELRCRISTYLLYDCLNNVCIGRLLLDALEMLERYVPAILSIIYANATPADAIGRV